MKHSNQRGMVSIMVTMIMMLVISLIVLGFAQVSRREQRQTLDRQLSTQAFFAAESGVNDIRDYIAKQPAGAVIPEKTVCPPTAEYPTTVANPKIDVTNNVSYPCLLVSTQLQNITASLTANGDSVSQSLISGAKVDKLRINFNLPTPPLNSDYAKCDNNAISSPPFSSAAGWRCPYGVLRMDIVPTDTLDRVGLAAAQKTIFFYPLRGNAAGNSAPYSTSNGTVMPMKCAVASGCSASLTGMNPGFIDSVAPGTGPNSYAVRLNAIYVGGTVSLTGVDGTDDPITFKNGQIMIDVTGKAQDVLRRIQVRLPVVPPGQTPDYALESGSSICKRFEITATTFKVPVGIVGQDANNPMCR